MTRAQAESEVDPPRAIDRPVDGGRATSSDFTTLAGRPLARRPSHEPPQGRKAARVSVALTGARGVL